MKTTYRSKSFLAAITLAAFAAPSAHAASPYTWTPTAAGITYNWNNASTQNNWGQGTASFPNAIDDVANMNIDIAGNQTVNLNQAITVGSLTIGDNSGAQTATLQAGTSGSLAFDVTSGNASLIRTATGTGATTISAPITLKDNLAVSLASGTAASTMTLSGVISESGGAKTLTKDSSTLTLALSGINSSWTGGIIIKNGTVNGQNNANSLGTGGVTLGGTGSTGATLIGGQNYSSTVNVSVNPPDSGSCVIGANSTGAGMQVGSITLNSANVTVQTFTAATTANITIGGGVTGTGNLVLNNLSTTAGNRVTLSGGNPVNHAGTITNQGAGSGTTLISSVIGANVISVTQNSSTAPLNLTAANLYTGPTNVDAGTLVLGHANAASNSSLVTVAAGAALQPSTSSSTVKKLTFSAAGTLSFDVASGYSLTVSDANGVTNSGAAGSVTINITGSVPANGTYPLISYSGTLQGTGFSAYTLGTKPPGKTYTLNNVAGVVQLVVSDLPAMNWTGLQSSEWSTLAIDGSKNWNRDAAPVDYSNGEAVLFDGTAANYTVDLSVADVAPSNVAFDNNGATPYTLQGSKAITGTTALTKSGSQTLTLTNTNTYTGATIINAGKLVIGGTGLLSSTATAGTYAGAITIADGATFEKSSGGSQTLSGAVTGLGTLKMSASGGGMILNNSGNGYKALDITAGRVFISTNTTALPAAATVSITTNGLLVFNTSGTYNNTITVGDNGGICSRNSSGATLTNVTLPGTGTVIFNNDDSATRLLTISKGQTLAGDLTVQIGGNRMSATTTELGAVTLSGVLTGSGGLTMVSSGNPLNTSLYGTGTLTLTGANNYSGTTTIKSGKLVLDTAANRLATTGAVVLGDIATTGKLVLGGTTAASQTLTALTTTGLGGSVVGGFTSNSTLFLNIATSNTFGGTLGGVGTNENNLALTKQGVGTLTLSSEANTFTGQVLSDSGTIQVTKLAPNGTASSIGAGTSSIRLGSDATAILEYIGTTDSSTNKVVQIGTNAAANTGSAAILNNSASGKLTFTAADFNQVVGAATVARALTLGGTYTGAANAITGIIRDNNTAGGGIVSLTKEGASTWALSGVNTYTGDTTVNSGVLAVNGTSIVNTGKLVIAGGMVDLTNTETVDTLFFGAVQQPAGNYSASSVPAGATITTASFSGGGTLTVVSGGGLTFADWKTANGAGSQTLSDDHDGDGVSNGVEFFLGGDTNTTGFTALPAVVKALDGTLSVTWIKHANYPGDYPDDFVVETSTTLGSWTPEPNPPGSVTISGNNVTYTFPGGPAYTGKKFARLVVTGP